MTKTKFSRLLAPVVVTVAGSVIAGAVAIGHTWADALIAELVTLVIGIGYFLLTGSDSDVGAIYGHRADERQRLVVMKAARLATIAMVGVAFVCVVITVALDDNYWQADVIGTLGGLSYVFGMFVYGAHDNDSVGSSRGIMAGSRTSERKEGPDGPSNG